MYRIRSESNNQSLMSWLQKNTAPQEGETPVDKTFNGINATRI